MLEGGERKGFDNPAEEAEISLTPVPQEAGFDEPFDKTTLASFSTGKFRTECVLLKRRSIGSEGRVKELMRVNDEISTRKK